MLYIETKQELDRGGKCFCYSQCTKLQENTPKEGKDGVNKDDAALTPWKMHKSYPPSMNWWIVIAAFRLLNVDDWLLTMQKRLASQIDW